MRWNQTKSTTDTHSNSETFLTSSSSTFSNSQNHSVTHSANVEANFRFEWLPDSLTNILMRANGTYDKIIDYWLNDHYIDADTFPRIPVPTEGEPLRVANVAANAPLAFKSGNEWYGLEMDLLREFANDLNRPLDIRFYDVTAAIMSIKTDKADLLSGGVLDTERASRIVLDEFRGGKISKVTLDTVPEA